MTEHRRHVATAMAYELKAGGFIGGVKDRRTGEVWSEKTSTLDEARNFAKQKAWELFPGCRLAAVRKRNEYYANVWL